MIDSHPASVLESIGAVSASGLCSRRRWGSPSPGPRSERPRGLHRFCGKGPI